MFDSLSLSYSLCILLRFTELIFGLEILQLSTNTEAELLKELMNVELGMIDLTTHGTTSDAQHRRGNTKNEIITVPHDDCIHANVPSGVRMHG